MHNPDCPLTDLLLSVRSNDLCAKLGVETVCELAAVEPLAILNSPNAGRATFAQLAAACLDHGCKPKWLHAASALFVFRTESAPSLDGAGWVPITHTYKPSEKLWLFAAVRLMEADRVKFRLGNCDGGIAIYRLKQEVDLTEEDTCS